MDKKTVLEQRPYASIKEGVLHATCTTGLRSQFEIEAKHRGITVAEAVRRAAIMWTTQMGKRRMLKAGVRDK